MADHEPRLCLTVPAEAANVALIRHALAGLAEGLGMDRAGIADLKTVVTEACMNAVVHAYPEEPGPIEVEAWPSQEALELRVVDHGVGFQPRPDVESPGSSLRLGLSLVAALSDRFAIEGSSDGGTAVTMVLPLHGSGEIPQLREQGEVDAAPAEVSISASAAELLPGVLSRAVSAFALRRDLTIDQVADAILLAETVSESSGEAFGEELPSFALADGEGGIEMTVGPLARGGGERLREGLVLPEDSGTVETLADKVEIDRRPEGEFVVFAIAAGD
ncbi:MAG: ATP-binding protein [Solirubrobacterales bacterium]|nr:ATP-binding protein [Solirubrobacterales bacterium]